MDNFAFKLNFLQITAILKSFSCFYLYLHFLNMASMCLFYVLDIQKFKNCYIFNLKYLFIKALKVSLKLV